MQKNYPKEFLEGERIFLRRHELAVAPAMYAVIDRDRARLSRFMPWAPHTKSQKDSEEFLRLTHMDWQDQKIFDYGIYLKSDRSFLGGAGVHTIAWEHERCELGYWLSGDAEGKGYALEAVGLLEQEMFRLGFHRLEIRCDARNERSAAVPRRAGFILEATLRDHMIELGRRRDTLIFTKLRASAENKPDSLS